MNVSHSLQAAVPPPLSLVPVHLTTITDSRPLFLWNGRFEAKGYRIEVRNERTGEILAFDDGFKIGELDPQTSIAPVVRFVPPEPLPWGTWRWRVRCVGADGKPSAWNVERRVTLSPTDDDAIEYEEPLVRPYLHLGRDRMETLRGRVRLDRNFELARNRLLAAADAVAELKIPTEDYARGDDGQHELYTLIGGMSWNRLSLLSLAWMLTGDERYAEAARRFMLRIASYERWTGEAFLDPERFDPIWHASLETAMITYGMAVGYDWLHDYLSEEDRATIREAMVKKGIEPLVHAWVNPETCGRIPRHQVPGGNWAMVCACSAGVGALAVLNEDPRARGWVRQVRDRTRWWLNYEGGEYMVDWPYAGKRPRAVIGPDDPNFGPDGGYRESIGYMHYAMIFVSYFSDALRGVSDEDLFRHVPGNILDPIAATLYRRTDNGRDLDLVADFGDSDSRAYFHDFYSCLSGNAPGRLGDLAAALHDRIVGRIPMSGRSMLWYDPDRPRERIGIPAAGKLFRGTGVVAFKGGSARNGGHAAFKTRQNRGHHDIGAFYFYSGGETWLTDSARCDYAHPIYQNFLSHSKAQCVVLVDERDQRRVDGILESFLAGRQFASARCDATAAYPEELESWKRSLLFAAPDLLIVVDRIRGRGEHRYEWLLHPGVEIRTRPQPPDEILLEGRTDSLSMRPILPRTWEVEEREGYYRQIPRPYYALRSQSPREDETFFVIMAPRIGETGRTRVLPVDDVEGAVVVERPDLELQLAVRVGDHPIRTADLGSDADLALVAADPADGRLRFASAQAGSYLLWKPAGEEPVLRSSPARDFLLELRPEGIFVATDGAEPAELEIRLPGCETLDDPDRAEVVVKTRAEGFVSLSVPKGRLEFLLRAPTARAVGGERENAQAPIDRTRPDAPVFHGARVRVSSAPGGVAVGMIDRNWMTNWHTIPAQALPQWCEIRLPRPQAVSRIMLCPTHLQDMTVSVRTGEEGWETVGGIESAPADQPVEFEFARGEIRAIRVEISRTSDSRGICGLWEVGWR